MPGHTSDQGETIGTWLLMGDEFEYDSTPPPVDLVQIEVADAEMRLRQALQLIVRSALRAQRGQLGETEASEGSPNAGRPVSEGDQE